MNKAILKSSTFWFGIIMALLPVFPVMQPLLTNEVVQSIVGLVIIAFRVKTTEGVSITGK